MSPDIRKALRETVDEWRREGKLDDDLHARLLRLVDRIPFLLWKIARESELQISLLPSAEDCANGLGGAQKAHAQK